MRRLRKSLYLQVITAVIIGAFVGHLFPEFGTRMKPLGDKARAMLDRKPDGGALVDDVGPRPRPRSPGPLVPVTP